jgi:hypothetical protein
VPPVPRLHVFVWSCLPMVSASAAFEPTSATNSTKPLLVKQGIVLTDVFHSNR